ncbi:serine protein kinase RIO [Candidatus Woesearchaeota archaeon]|nr:serine protein kinase RIO [Candidatus Woesearchaeota archaeon]
MVVRRSREEWKIYGNVFDKFTIDVLQRLEARGHFDALASGIALGKEANVFTATPAKAGEDYVIVKIYRLENCNFKKMYEYLKFDPRYMHTKPSKRFVVFAWCQREYRNLLIAREAGLRCPTPLAFKDNVMVMSLIGDGKKGTAAKQLKDTAPKDPEAFSKLLLKDIKKLWKKGLVHGDLSAFNLLLYKEKPVFIDFSQSSPTSAPNAKELLKRDLKNVASYLKRHGVDIDMEKEFKSISTQ